MTINPLNAPAKDDVLIDLENAAYEAEEAVLEFCRGLRLEGEDL